MGNTVIIMSLVNVLVGTKDINILMTGLDGAGKTTILEKLNLGGIVTPISLMGFDIKKVEYENVRLEVFDLGGKVISPLLWRYFQNTQGLIFVVDSNDRERLTEAKEELNRLLNEDALRNAALLVFANAEDHPTSMSVAEVTEILALHHIRNRSWYIQRASATRGDGLYEGLEWLTGQLSRS